MRRNYLWKGNTSCKGINYLVNWDRVCTSKEVRGLGIINLTCQNDALLTKWILKIAQNEEGLWAYTIRRLHGITTTSQLESTQIQSFFYQAIGTIAIILQLLNLSGRWNKVAMD